MDLQKFKLCVLCHDKFRDADIEKLFLELEVEDDQDIEEAIDVLRVHRPELYKQLGEKLCGGGLRMSDNHWAENLAARLEPERQTEFVQFVTTGKASDDFLSHLDLCHTCQNAVEEAFRITSRQFEVLGKIIARVRNK